MRIVVTGGCGYIGTCLTEDLLKNGFSVVIYANHLLRASYKIMKKTALDILRFNRSYETEKNIVSVNAAFAPELTIEFINKGFRIIEIPVNYYPRNMGVSKLSGTYIKSGVTALKMLKIILQKRFLYLFSK